MNIVILKYNNLFPILMVWNIFRNGNDITAAEVKARMEGGWSPFIVDVRSLAEVKKLGKIKGTSYFKNKQRFIAMHLGLRFSCYGNIMSVQVQPSTTSTKKTGLLSTFCYA